MKIDLKLFQIGMENLFIDTNLAEYKWMKKNYKKLSDSEREWQDFDDSFVNVSIGKHTLKNIAPNVMPEQPIETLVLVGKGKGKTFNVENIVLTRFLFDGPGTYEIIGTVNKDEITEVQNKNKKKVFILKMKKIK